MNSNMKEKYYRDSLVNWKIYKYRFIDYVDNALGDNPPVGVSAYHKGITKWILDNVESIGILYEEDDDVRDESNICMTEIEPDEKYSLYPGFDDEHPETIYNIEFRWLHEGDKIVGCQSIMIYGKQPMFPGLNRNSYMLYPYAEYLNYKNTKYSNTMIGDDVLFQYRLLYDMLYETKTHAVDENNNVI